MTASRRLLRNAYFALRHGRSEANEAGIIASRPENGVPRFGLSARGRAEAAEKLRPERVAALGIRPATALCVSSDFRRARETAELLCALNGLAAPILDPRLRERSFGDLELEPSERGYEGVWAFDRDDPDNHAHGCESTREVRARLLALIDDLERAHAGRAVVLVSHGDPLQVLETAFAGLPPNAHRTLPHLETAEVRRLGDALPQPTT